MLKKTLKKLIALTLATVTVATGSTAVSASTLTPKKSHSVEEITEYVDYFNDITDRYAFRPDGYIPVGSNGRYHDGQAYKSWQMTILLQNTSGITSEQKADMKTAAATWKRSYLSERMLYIYQTKWSDKMYYYLDDDRTSKSWASKYKARAKKTYTEIDAFINKNAKYNQKLAGELKKFNKQRLDIYNKAINNWCFKMTKSQKSKYISPICGSGIGDKPQASIIQYVDAVFSKSKMESNFTSTTFGLQCTKHISVDDYHDTKLYALKTLGLHGYDLNPNGANPTWNRHIQWKKW
ncbi:MAG: hypothetical protein JNG48_14760 [Blautia sp.]|nr:hypothetical protein [Blautia sp.]